MSYTSSSSSGDVSGKTMLHNAALSDFPIHRDEWVGLGEDVLNFLEGKNLI